MISLFEILLLALTIFFEAGGEPYNNKVAHAWVVKNRVDSELFADSYYDVVFQPKHFSCYNPNEVDKHLKRVYSMNAVELKSLAECICIAYGVYHGDIPDNTGGSLWYSLKYKRRFGQKVRLFRVWMKHLKVNAEYGSEYNPTVYYGV